MFTRMKRRCLMKRRSFPEGAGWNMATVAVGRELQMMREVERIVYVAGRELERTDLLKKLKKKRKYRKLEPVLRVIVGLALTVPREEGGYFFKLKQRRSALEAKLEPD
jgi:hypothetical protein